MPRYNSQKDFEQGLGLLVPFFDKRGYSLSHPKPHRDKEGTYYFAHFSRPPRTVELTHLYSLGPVTYRIRDCCIEHVQYLAALGVAGAAHYPSYADDSQSGYRALLNDLEELLLPFFVGAEHEFVSIARADMGYREQLQTEDKRMFNYRYSLDPGLKTEARELFRQGRYQEVIQIEEKLRFPEFISEPERRLFALARKRL